MLPYIRLEKINGTAIGISASCCLKDCGHNAIELRIDFFWRTLFIGIEFG
jgi:hypothetical protein